MFTRLEFHWALNICWGTFNFKTSSMLRKLSAIVQAPWNLQRVTTICSQHCSGPSVIVNKFTKSKKSFEDNFTSIQCEKGEPTKAVKNDRALCADGSIKMFRRNLAWKSLCREVDWNSSMFITSHNVMAIELHAKNDSSRPPCCPLFFNSWVPFFVNLMERRTKILSFSFLFSKSLASHCN